MITRGYAVSTTLPPTKTLVPNVSLHLPPYGGCVAACMRSLIFSSNKAREVTAANPFQGIFDLECPSARAQLSQELVLQTSGS